MVVELGIGKKSASERGDQRGLEASGIIKMQRQSRALVAATRPRRPRGRLSGNLPIKLLRCCSSSSADSGSGWSQKATGGAIAAPLGIAELQLLPGHARATLPACYIWAKCRARGTALEHSTQAIQGESGSARDGCRAPRWGPRSIEGMSGRVSRWHAKWGGLVE